MGPAFAKWNKKMPTLFTLYEVENNLRDGYNVRSPINATDTTCMKTPHEVCIQKFSLEQIPAQLEPLTRLSAQGGRIRGGKKKVFPKKKFGEKKIFTRNMGNSMAL